MLARRLFLPSRRLTHRLVNPIFTHRVRYVSSNSADAVPSATPSSPNHLSKEELDKIIHLMERDPLILMEVVAHLKPEDRRRLIVAGGAVEWFGKDSAEREVRAADQDNDRQISPKDFDHWFENAQRRKQEEKKKKAAEEAEQKEKKGVEATAESTTTSTKTKVITGAVPFAALCLIGLEAGLPFVGFGFLDNATMILAGDFIDGTLGFYLNCSVLASAAMGNVCSGMLGMQVHGLIDKAVQKLNFNTPVLTDEQMKDRRVFFAGHLGGTIGIMIGLTLGMLPLLFMDNDTNEKTDYAMFQRWDINNSGFVEKAELEKVLVELGLSETETKATLLMKKYGQNNRVNFEQFCDFKDDLREGKPIFEA
ncbi:hypothetical protein AGDE_02278 [Angomonas deanei]|nr:hypothetical protein AGDE_02278 [Angomonas deanei]|eukprot:EPY41646.1 hypothetical protein AGDE_02278 [Angomonas deanei]